MTNVIFVAGLFNVTANWLWHLLRGFFAFFDTLIYGFITIFFRTIFHLSNFELVSLYEVFEQRIYVMLGIFMLFKVTVSLITYLVNPDKIADKEQGMAKVVTRIITVLVMLIALPTFFNLMTEFQNKLLPVIPRVIIGTANTLESDDVTGIASNMSLTLLQGFASYKSDECVSSDVENIWGNETTNNLSRLSDFLVHINDTCEDAQGRKIYAYDYLPGFSTIVGLLMIYVLFSLCITVAIRAFKLIILRMIAPIPIVSYIDPKSSKNGMFSTWVKTFLSTWGELFLLLGIIYFIVYMIDFLLSGDFYEGFFTGVTNPIDMVLILAFLMVGLLFFAKQAPKFLFDALGIKTKGTFMKMLGMGATALGMGGAFASSLAARNRYDQEQAPLTGLGRAKNIGASLFSGLASGAAGGNAILSADNSTWSTGIDAQNKFKAKDIDRIGVGSTARGRAKSTIQSILFGEDAYQKMQRELQSSEAYLQDAKGVMDALKKEATKGKYGTVTVTGGYIGDSQVVGKSTSLRAQAQVAISKGEEIFYYHHVDEEGKSYVSKVSTTDYERIAGDMEKREMQLLANRMRTEESVRNDNPELYTRLEAVLKATTEQSIKDAAGNLLNVDDVEKGIKNLDTATQIVARDVAEIKNNPEFQQGKANSEKK